MLPGVRFMIGAVAAMAMLGVAVYGLLTSVRLAHEARITPLESRSMAFTERADWNELWQRDPALRPDEALPDAPGTMTLRDAAQHAFGQPVLPDFGDSFMTAQAVSEAAQASASDVGTPGQPIPITPDAVTTPAPPAPDATPGATRDDQPAAIDDNAATPKAMAVAEQVEPEQTPASAPAPAEGAAAAAPAAPVAEEPGTTGSINPADKATDTRDVELAPADQGASEPAPDATRTATAPATESATAVQEPVAEPAAPAKTGPAKASKRATAPKKAIHRRFAKPKAPRVVRRSAPKAAAQTFTSPTQTGFSLGETSGASAPRTSQTPFSQSN